MNHTNFFLRKNRENRFYLKFTFFSESDSLQKKLKMKKSILIKNKEKKKISILFYKNIRIRVYVFQKKHSNGCYTILKIPTFGEIFFPLFRRKNIFSMHRWCLIRFMEEIYKNLEILKIRVLPKKETKVNFFYEKKKYFCAKKKINLF